MSTRAARNQKAYRERKRARKAKEERVADNDLVREFVEAMGPGNVFNIAPVEHPDVDGVVAWKLTLVFPNNEARLRVFQLAERHGIDVNTLVDRVTTRGFKNFTDDEGATLVE